jgi:sulfite reductase alpha subunit-like flavoprotein
MSIPIYYATMTGNSRDLAERTERRLNAMGIEASAKDMFHEKPESLAGEKVALFIISTWGDGEPPDDAVDYVARLEQSAPLGLEGLEYSVCGLGDTGYEIFCGCGKTIDARLEAHGAQPLVPRVDCDVDFEDMFGSWLDAVVHALEARRAVA